MRSIARLLPRDIKGAGLLAVIVCGCQGTFLPEGAEDPSSTDPGRSVPGSGPRVAASCAPVPARLWKLTPAQYSRTLQAILGDSAANAGEALAETLPTKTGFINADTTLDLSVEHLSGRFDSAEKLAAAVVADPRIFPCRDKKATDQACLRAFLEKLAAKAFRRPLTTAEVYRYLTLFGQAQKQMLDEPT